MFKGYESKQHEQTESREHEIPHNRYAHTKPLRTVTPPHHGFKPPPPYHGQSSQMRYIVDRAAASSAITISAIISARAGTA